MKEQITKDFADVCRRYRLPDEKINQIQEAIATILAAEDESLPLRRAEKSCDPLPTRPGSSPVALRAPSDDPGLASPSLFRSIEAPPRIFYFTLIGVQKNCRPNQLPLLELIG